MSHERVGVLNDPLLRSRMWRSQEEVRAICIEAESEFAKRLYI